MNKTISVLTVLTALTLMSVASVYAVEVWRWTTKITVMEPFEVVSDLPTETSLYPGDHSYTINVTNHGEETLNATLCYVIKPIDCFVAVTPQNETSYTVNASETISIPVTITISIKEYPANGTAIIDWWIERITP